MRLTGSTATQGRDVVVQAHSGDGYPLLQTTGTLSRTPPEVLGEENHVLLSVGESGFVSLYENRFRSGSLETSDGADFFNIDLDFDAITVRFCEVSFE